MNNDALQYVALLLGILTQSVAILREFKKAPAAKEDPPGPDPKTVQGPAPELAGPTGKSLLDLSFVLLCATFFSLLLMDSLVISGRAPSPGLRTIVAVLAITAVVFIVMFGAWRFGKAEKVTGFLAITTLAVLIISPGGPFGDNRFDAKDVQVGLTLYIPVLSLVTLAATMMIYSYGNPLSNMVEPRRRRAVSLTLLTLFVVGACVLGQHFVTQVMRDDKTPKVEHADAKGLLREISGWDRQMRQRFYQFAAEIALAHKYQEDNQQIRSRQRQLEPAADTGEPDEDAAPAASPAPGAAALAGRGGAAPAPATSPAAEYLRKHFDEQLRKQFGEGLPPRLSRLIATLSYGVPRDIIRRCDEYLAAARAGGAAPRLLAFGLREIQANLGYELRQLSSTQAVALGGDAMTAALTAQGLLGNGLAGEAEQQHRLVLSLWLIALIELAIDLPDERRWLEQSNRMCGVGYKLSVERSADLQPEVEELHAGIIAFVGVGGEGAAPAALT